ncbi:MAG: hypothetical protein M0R48_01240 [Candidatus Omnitrophica bacterium]|jgi:hypothetical protein|nr:hypothetical protein [Candidatus Omnitrophota bacterium]
MRFYFFAILLFSGCAATTPQATSNDSANTNVDVLRFEQAKALSASDIPDINISRLSKGSNVKIKHIQDGLGRTYFTVKTVKDVKAADNGKIYVIDSVTEGRTYTFSEDSASLRKVVSPYENIQPLADFKDPSMSGMPATFINALGAGGIGIALIPVTRSQERERNKEAGDHARGMRVERKITDFKFVSDEVLKIADKDILCKVYQIHSLTRQTMPATKTIPSTLLIINTSERIWISEDVPFGIAKRESTQTLHMSLAGGGRSRRDIIPSAQTTRETNEVVEFSY